MKNFTIVVPDATTNHGFEELLCTPPKWTDYIVFFVANYVSHTATIVSRPGETLVETGFTILNALFLPGSGALRTLRSIMARPSLASDELERAARAGALCTVLQEWPLADSWQRKVFEGDFRILHPSRKVHGDFRVRPGYLLVELPWKTPLKEFRNGVVGAPRKRSGKPRLAYTYNIPKVLVGLFQVIWGAVTLYRSRGNQIEMYGYAAFGLSVAPFVFMSAVNIAMALVTPEYPTLYLVHCPDMDHHMEDFDGIVAAIDINSPGGSVPADDLIEPGIFLFGSAIAAIIPVAIVGSFSGFKSGDWSTPSDRGWMMSWLVVGAASSLYVRILHNMAFHGGVAEHTAGLAILTAFVLPLWVPAIGGIITVGKMLGAYGICTRLNV